MFVKNRPIDIIEPIRDNIAKMYNYNIKEKYSNIIMNILKEYTPTLHTVINPSNSLAKLLEYQYDLAIQNNELFCHQADYITCQFIKQIDNNKITIPSDWHNCFFKICLV